MRSQYRTGLLDHRLLYFLHSTLEIFFLKLLGHALEQPLQWFDSREVDQELAIALCIFDGPNTQLSDLLAL